MVLLFASDAGWAMPAPRSRRRPPRRGSCGGMPAEQAFELGLTLGATPNLDEVLAPRAVPWRWRCRRDDTRAPAPRRPGPATGTSWGRPARGPSWRLEERDVVRELALALASGWVDAAGRDRDLDPAHGVFASRVDGRVVDRPATRPSGVPPPASRRRRRQGARSRPRSPNMARLRGARSMTSASPGTSARGPASLQDQGRSTSARRVVGDEQCEAARQRTRVRQQQRMPVRR